jgi:cobalt/nickel transport system permease protein
MHIPDGFLDLWVAGLFFALAAAAIGWSILKLDGEVPTDRVPLLGVVAAGIFAAQMLNWPIPGGTSAHFVGGAFAALLLGPYLGCLAMTAVVVVQALVFGDGGVLALGANLWNLAVVDVFVAYALYRAVSRYNETAAVFVAGWGAITAAALFAGLQAGLSSTFAYEIGTTLAVMGIGHALLGLIEGAITLAVYRQVDSLRPDLLFARPAAASPDSAEVAT